MNSLRFNLFLLLGLAGALKLTFSVMAYQNFRELRETRRHLELSYALRDLAQEHQGIKPGGEVMLRLRNHARNVQPERRRLELTQWLDTIDAGKVVHARERQRVFLRNEAEFQRVTREHMTYLEERLIYFSTLALLAMIAGFVGLPWFMQRRVIRPMRDLSRKMVDFLHDRYTYQYSVPTSDEVGQMQSTFNSLAQRVISNMQELKTLDEAKSEFLSIASHELRTPLTSIKGSLSLLRAGVAGKMDEMADQLLTIAETETDRLIRLINDILDLAKIEARKLPLQQDWRSLSDLIKTSLEGLRGLSQQANVQLEFENPSTMEAHMDVDRIQQVLTNLLSNAIKFSPAGSTVKVQVEITERNHLLITVRDQGRGIAPEDQAAIFQKFRQASNARNPLVKGTGLGLAIAKALVEQHGGEIGVRSTVGVGSAFYFTLPNWRFARANSAMEKAA